VLRQCAYCGVETLLVEVHRVRKKVEPTMKALASLEPEQVEATDADAKRDLEHCRAAHEALRHPDELHPLERAMTDGRSWEGNWKVRLYERARERGYESLTALPRRAPPPRW
jgi:hypothetical protein